MIRPEVAALFRRWAEPVLATGGTLIAFWIAGGLSLRWGWLSVILSMIILVAGGLWIRESIRRMRFASNDTGGGKVFIEERRVLYIGAVGNVQVDLADVERIDLAFSKPNGASWTTVLLYASGGLPAAIPLNAEGEEAFVDALCSLPGVRFNDLRAAIADQSARGRFAPVVTFWRRQPSG